MAIQSFDQINILKRHSIPYDEYYGDMLLTDKQKKERKDFALILEDILSIFFEIMFTEMTMGVLDRVDVRQQLVYSLYEAIENENFFEDEEQFTTYLFLIIDELMKSTEENMNKAPNDYDYKGEKPYWVSEDRAQFIAENESNTLYNIKDYNTAKEQGKTHKIWMAYPDDRVRLTHQITNGSKVPIDAYFTVGNARMLYPKDVTSELSTGAEFPEEVINCRCTVKYV